MATNCERRETQKRQYILEMVAWIQFDPGDQFRFIWICLQVVHIFGHLGSVSQLLHHQRSQLMGRTCSWRGLVSQRCFGTPRNVESLRGGLSLQRSLRPLRAVHHDFCCALFQQLDGGSVTSPVKRRVWFRQKCTFESTQGCPSMGPSKISGCPAEIDMGPILSWQADCISFCPSACGFIRTIKARGLALMERRIAAAMPSTTSRAELTRCEMLTFYQLALGIIWHSQNLKVSKSYEAARPTDRKCHSHHPQGQMCTHSSIWSTKNNYNRSFHPPSSAHNNKNSETIPSTLPQDPILNNDYPYTKTFPLGSLLCDARNKKQTTGMPWDAPAFSTGTSSLGVCGTVLNSSTCTPHLKDSSGFPKFDSLKCWMLDLQPYEDT